MIFGITTQHEDLAPNPTGPTKPRHSRILPTRARGLPSNQDSQRQTKYEPCGTKLAQCSGVTGVMQAKSNQRLTYGSDYTMSCNAIRVYTATIVETVPCEDSQEPSYRQHQKCVAARNESEAIEKLYARWPLASAVCIEYVRLYTFRI